MITQKDKDQILDALNQVDPKKLKIDHPNEMAVKWFRFGSYSGIQIASGIIKQLPIKKKKTEES